MPFLRPMRLRRRLMLSGAAGLLLASCDGRAPAFRNTDVTGADFGKGFELTDHWGQTRRLEDFRGKVLAVFFGFTHCPDVCPSTLAEMAEVMARLGPRADQLQVVFITVDPPSIRASSGCGAISKPRPEPPSPFGSSSRRSKARRPKAIRSTIPPAATFTIGPDG
jgi:hypothetical protein